MERPKCKLCSKIFSNGKALGGHMKAHFAALPIPSKTRSQLSDRTDSAPSSSSERQQQHEHEEEEDSSRAQAYVLRSNPKKSFVLADPSCHRFDAVSSGAESPPRTRPARRRRSSKRKLVSAESTPLSSVTDSFSPEEDVALCLMMLSRDTGGESARPGQASRAAAQYECGTCGKVFKSHQALGGHVASHKRAANKKNSSENGVGAARPMLLDLNMPAPLDDDDDDVDDQLDLSAGSQIQS